MGPPDSPLVAIVDEALAPTADRAARFDRQGSESINPAEDFLERRHLERTGCAILDVKLPGASGVGLQPFVARPRPVPMVFVSAHEDPVTRANVLRASAIAFLKKRFDDSMPDALDLSTRQRSAEPGGAMPAIIGNRDVPAGTRPAPQAGDRSRRGEARDDIIVRSARSEGTVAALVASGSCGREAGASPGAAQPGPRADVPRVGRSSAGTDDGLPAFLGVRSRLFGIACRMLGSAVDAEDVVQDVWIRWQTADRRLVRSAAAFLTTTATRLAINVKQSARSRREACAGPGLPEPVDTGADPPTQAQRDQELACGMQLLLETLAPAERAAYILREAFDYSYRDIASVLRLEEANARQVVTRARQHVARGRKTAADSTEHRRLIEAFTAAAHDGDVARLEGLLASGVRLALPFHGHAPGSGIGVKPERQTSATAQRPERPETPLPCAGSRGCQTHGLHVAKAGPRLTRRVAPVAEGQAIGDHFPP